MKHLVDLFLEDHMFSFKIYNRYRFFKVLLFTFLASFALFVQVYVYRLAAGIPFNWVAYREYLLNQFVGTIATAVFYFFALNKFHLLFAARKRYYNFIVPLIAGIIAVSLYNLVVDRLLPLSSNINDPLPLEKQLLGHFLVALFFLITALIIAYINNLRDVRKAHKELEQQKLQLEVEKAHSELKFLKSQINPHFLHNTLNSFYARSLPFSKELADGILTLSEMMRYALEETNTGTGKVSLKDEAEHVRNLIRLNQFRFRNDLQIGLEIKGVLNGYTIIPFVLITLVENIFKHGDLSDHTSPIVILLEVEDGSFRYYSRNKKKTGSKELSRGIGLHNIKKRLDIAYGQDYRLSINDETNFYTTELIINKL